MKCSLAKKKREMEKVNGGGGGGGRKKLIPITKTSQQILCVSPQSYSFFIYLQLSGATAGMYRYTGGA